MLQTKIVQKIKTPVLCSVTFLPENRAVCENVGKRCSAEQATVLYGACLKIAATHTHT